MVSAAIGTLLRHRQHLMRNATSNACVGRRGAMPLLSVPAAERQVAGAGRHAASLRFAENVPFTVAYVVDAMDRRHVDWPVAHAAAIPWQAVKAGEPLTVLSQEPELYAGTGITPLNPT